MKKARLIITYDCNKDCEGCCNKDWKYTPPRPVTIEEVKKYDEVCITGGEPMLYPEKVEQIIDELRPHVPIIILYTAYPYPISAFFKIIYKLDGFTVTLHDEKDKVDFERNGLHRILFFNKTMRLNSFVEIDYELWPSWNFKKVEWIKDCPLPENEELLILED